MPSIVIFYDAEDLPRSLKEIRRTNDLDEFVALNVYANTPNPASVILHWATEGEKQKVLAEHGKNIVDPKWLTALYEAI